MSIFVLLLLATLPPGIGAQATKVDIEARLKGKPLYLRGSWRDEHLRFDADGKLIGTSAPISFTLTGFSLRSVSMKPDRLVLGGSQIGTEFHKGVLKRIELGDLRIEVAKPASGDFRVALDAVFAESLDDLATSLPSYWQGYARCKLTQPADSSKCALYITDKPKSHSPNLWETPPRITHQVAAEFNQYARALRYSGSTRVAIVIGSDGSLSHLAVIHPAGLGLDEQALAAIVQYKFAPAMKDGKPIQSEVEIEVSFQTL